MKFVGVLVVGLIVAYSSRESDGLGTVNHHDDDSHKRDRRAIIVFHHPANGQDAQPGEFPANRGMQSSASEPSPATGSMFKTLLSRIMSSFYGQHQHQQPKAEEETPRILIPVIASNPQQQNGNPPQPQFGYRRVATSEQPSMQMVRGSSNDGGNDEADSVFGRIIKVTRTQIHRIKMYFTPSSSSSSNKDSPPSTTTHTVKTIQYNHPDGTTTTTTTSTHYGDRDEDGNRGGGQSPQSPSVFRRFYKTMRSAFPF